MGLQKGVTEKMEEMLIYAFPSSSLLCPLLIMICKYGVLFMVNCFTSIN